MVSADELSDSRVDDVWMVNNVADQLNCCLVWDEVKFHLARVSDSPVGRLPVVTDVRVHTGTLIHWPIDTPE